MSPVRQSQVDEKERRLFLYGRRHFQISAKVHLSDVTFEQGFRSRMDNQRSIRRSKKLMEIQGCQRLMRKNHLPVIMSRNDWRNRVVVDHSQEDMPYLTVVGDYQLHALDHRNLIAAACQWLDIDDQWWIADIYVTNDDVANADSTALHHEFIQSMTENFTNDNRPPDGLIYERINYYEGFLDGPQDRLAADNWYAVLQVVVGSRKRKYLERFFKIEKLHLSLNSLLVIGGLWEDMRIGVLHKVTAMCCDEAVSCYWQTILTTFNRLVMGRRELLSRIDGVSVNLIQSRAPKVSDQDLRFLQSKMDDGQLFRHFPDDIRYELWEQLQDIDYPIPTLKTFFKDRIYLEVAQSVMKQLVPPPVWDKRLTIDEGICQMFDTAVSIPHSLGAHYLREDLLEFWRFSFQYGFEMTEHQRLKGTEGHDVRNSSSLIRHRPTTLSESDLWRHLYAKLRSRGFRLLEAGYPVEPEPELPPLIPCDYPEETTEEIEVEKRCGKPFSNTVEADRFALSAESLQQTSEATRVTAGFLRKWVFRAFFGYLMENTAVTS
ncbi:uncharacterized protein N7483_002545 [Penicillium malachiteum]|uniref:uncharacterized protein n=1 Tax=Penicillium malachiteum TaxID=1324776 RepID=UPI0025474D88|nr:uncharacterized protein N7483_002413 [Penicillium malachiteum]XP_056952131.1 uncharacterized protein N7483_002545 [Penicillium malachiteum]KAJ5737288.1 hypothetical protein N7483_002413 [Penicillium malachiteum]KAJ5737420.1 hypothetical protein N7483_002545 [Penicillium malachiteum]